MIGQVTKWGLSGWVRLMPGSAAVPTSFLPSFDGRVRQKEHLCVLKERAAALITERFNKTTNGGEMKRRVFV